MGQDLLGCSYRGQTAGSWVGDKGGRLLMVGSGAEGVTWRYAVCQFCLGKERVNLHLLQILDQQ